MASFVYKGIPAKKQTELLALYMADVRPQDPRGRAPLYHIDAKDSEETKEVKRDRKKKYMADREAEYKKELKGMDEKAELMDSLGQKYVFEKGKVVDVPETSSLIKRLEAMVLNGIQRGGGYWEKAEKAEKVEKPAKKDPYKEEKTPGVIHIK